MNYEIETSHNLTGSAKYSEDKTNQSRSNSASSILAFLEPPVLSSISLASLCSLSAISLLNLVHILSSISDNFVSNNWVNCGNNIGSKFPDWSFNAKFCGGFSFDCTEPIELE